MFQQFRNPNAIPTCGVYVIVNNDIKFLPIASLDVHTSIVASTSRTVLTQTFITTGSSLKNVKYAFPLYEGVSVVGFECTIGSRIIKGVVKEREEAKQEYQQAVASGQFAGLLEQSLEASDVFTTSLGNIPKRTESVKVEITYLGELKHDAQVDGLRFTIPTKLAPRYGHHSITDGNTFQGGKHINITIDTDVSSGSAIKSIQSPSHPISVNIGTLSTATSAPPSLQKAHATLSQGSAELDKDFIIQIVATGLGDPMAVLETHPTIPNQRALMTTLVPRFNLPMQMAEVVFLCDRSGSMGGGQNIPNVIAALKIFLKSLPVGVKFNICSFGSRYSFLWERSMTYGEETLATAIRHVSEFAANFGGTEMYSPMEEVFKRRYNDMNLEVFLLTDGEIWQQEQLFQLINNQVAESKGAIRVFTLGVGRDVSHALIEGVARAGNGFAQTVGENEKMDKMLVRMLKGALTPHITDYSLEIKYDGNDGPQDETGDDFEVIERVMDAMTLEMPSSGQAGETRTEEAQQPISLFDQSVQDTDLEMPDISSVKVKLPPVAVPRYLQAPFQIPALFPFSRTSVYVLLSDSTPNRQPKSVILRGTSVHGPLSLEIPIATLTEKGTTIHQLAARKATRELEDGRGWIFHVKNQDGKLLQQQFEGQFSDMVKREAVRLGTQYQVSGKWCSFVAIQDANKRQEVAERSEGGDEHEEEEDDDDEEASDFEGLSFDTAATVSVSTTAFGAAVPQPQSAGGRAPRHTMAAFAARMSVPDSGSAKRKMVATTSMTAQQQVQQQQQQPQQQQAPRRDRDQVPRPAQQSPVSLFGSSHTATMGFGENGGQPMGSSSFGGTPTHMMAFGGNGGPSGGLFGQPQYKPSTGLFGSASTTTGGGLFGNSSFSSQSAAAPFGSSSGASSGGLFGNSSASAPASGGLFGSKSNSAPATGGMFGSMGSPPSAGSSLFGNASPAYGGLPGSSSSNTSGGMLGSGSNDPLSTLSALQTFAGNWQWNPSLEAVLGIPLLTVLEKIQLSAQYTLDMDVLATICAVVFLKKKLASEKDTWELLVQKAEDWLRAQTGAGVSELVRNVEDKLFSN